MAIPYLAGAAAPRAPGRGTRRAQARQEQRLQARPLGTTTLGRLFVKRERPKARAPFAVIVALDLIALCLQFFGRRGTTPATLGPLPEDGEDAVSA